MSNKFIGALRKIAGIGDFREGKPVQYIGKVDGIPQDSPLGKFLDAVPVADSNPTEAEWKSAVDAYKRLLSHKELGEGYPYTSENGNHATQMMLDMWSPIIRNYELMGDVSHKSNIEGLDALWNMYHRGLDKSDIGKDGRVNSEAVRQKLIDIASKRGNENFRNAIYNGMTNRINNVYYLRPWDENVDSDSWQSYLDKHYRAPTGVNRKYPYVRAK